MAVTINGNGTITGATTLTNFDVYGSTGSFKAYVSSDPAESLNSDTIIPFDAKLWDTKGWFDTSTYRYTPQIAGYYHLFCCVGFENILSNDNEGFYVKFRKNGSNFISPRARYGYDDTFGNRYSPMTDIFLQFNGSTDYVECFYHTSDGNVVGGDLTTESSVSEISASDVTQMWGYLVEPS